jgi:hypothetical protein
MLRIFGLRRNKKQPLLHLKKVACSKLTDFIIFLTAVKSGCGSPRKTVVQTGMTAFVEQNICH